MDAPALKVLQVCPYDIRRAGGVQRHVIDLSNALAGAGHAVTIVAPAGAGDSPALHPGVTLVALGTFREWRMHGTRFEVTRVCAAELERFIANAAAAPFDVAHFHTPWTPFMSWPLYRRAKAFAKRKVATFHDTPPPGAGGAATRAVFRVLSRRLSRTLDAMIAVSGAPARHLRPVEGCPLVLLPPCVDLTPYARLQRPESGSAPTVLFVGRLEPRKGVLMLIEAFARVRADHPAARLVICGDGEQRPAATRLAASRAVSGAVTFTGALSDAAKLALYGQAQVFCAPSPYGESYGLVIAEAMAAGVPVVAAANAGYASVLTGEGAAGLAPPGDTAALARCLSALLASQALRAKLSAWGLAHAARADVNARLADFLDLYRASRTGPAGETSPRAGA